MGNNWPILPLENMATVIDSRHKTPQYSEIGYPMVRVVDIKGGELSLADAKNVTADVYADFSKGRDPEIGDLIISRVGSYGNVSYVSSKQKFCLGQNTALIIPEDKDRFLYYALSSPQLRRQIDNMAVGAVQKTISLKSIKGLEVPQPPAQERTNIANFLSFLDDKITLNRQINKTLEQMAQALFKSWFVDFDPVVDNALDTGFFEQDLELPEELLCRAEVRKAVRESSDFKPLSNDIRQLFPAAFEKCSEPSLGLGGWVPEGWESLPVSSLIDLIGGGTPKTSEHSYWGGDIPWFSVVDAPNDSDVFVLSTEKKITDLGVKNSSTKVLRIGTTIISARGTVGKCALVAIPMAMNQSCYGVIGTNGIHDYFIYYLIRQSVSQLQQRSHGSVFSTITRDTFNSFNFAFSGELIANTFGETISPWFEKIRANNQQKYMLQNLRDTLLPKLISGELRLSNSKVNTADEVLA